MIEKTPLIAAAEAVRDARAELERIAGRLAELREESRDLEALKANLASARARRRQRLADRKIAGQKASSTDKIDKDVAAAQEALQLREDEIIAVDGALEGLAGQREQVLVRLAAAETTFKQRRAEHVSDLRRAQDLPAKIGAELTAIRSHLASVPPAYVDERLRRLQAELEQWGAAAEQVLLDLAPRRDDLRKADELAALPDPEMGRCLGVLDEHGNLIPLEEPEEEARAAPEPPTRVLRPLPTDAATPGFRGIQRIADADHPDAA